MNNLRLGNDGKLRRDRWKCEDCKGKMYVVKYKKSKDFVGFGMKKAVCYYCKSEKIEYIGEVVEEKEELRR